MNCLLRPCLLMDRDEISNLHSFYRGMTASYFGVTETVIHFVIYESLKARLLEYNGSGLNHDRQASDFLRFIEEIAFVWMYIEIYLLVGSSRHKLDFILANLVFIV
jgi:hypothetical protein